MTACKGRLQSKIALVTGGTKGIGKATVQAFLREGATVVFTGTTEEVGTALERELRSAGHQTRFIQCDGRDEQQISDMLGDIVKTYGRLDIAVNNVGSTAPSDNPLAMLHESSLTGFEDTVARNLTSTFLSMKYELAVMLEQGGGVICNNSSMAGVRIADVASPGYQAAKAAVIHLTRKAAIQYAKKNIRVNAISPGATATEHVLGRWSREEFDQLATIHPMGRAVTPEECAEAFLYLCSNESSAVTGHMIPIDGGWTAN